MLNLLFGSVARSRALFSETSLTIGIIFLFIFQPIKKLTNPAIGFLGKHSHARTRAVGKVLAGQAVLVSYEFLGLCLEITTRALNDLIDPDTTIAITVINEPLFEISNSFSNSRNFWVV